MPTTIFSHHQILASNFSITMSFTAINIAPGLSDFAAAAAGNCGDPPPTKKPIGLRAQCDKEGSGSESGGDFVVVNTSGKRRGNRVGAHQCRHSKRAQRLLTEDASDSGDVCPEWCCDDESLPAYAQQARRCGHVIWAQPDHTLSGASACACCTSLWNPRGQCQAEPPAIAAPDSGSPGVVVPPAHNARGMGTRSWPLHQQSLPCPSPATTGTLYVPRSRSLTPEELVAAMAVLPESTAHALRLLNAHQSCRRHEYIEFIERHRIEEMGLEASSDGEDGSGTAGEEYIGGLGSNQIVFFQALNLFFHAS
ncbi:MAG: hypothetical protein FRX48_03956 [Lasallia pustulata]|uniref:Uncharacterized protein n=1 Tax=Lasallia pustulata TaxID=136370 RepID=A0A5M8PSX6_9LECA|nr:MAG: hypothetical protein FRX48_03956 [Lasallia pustulata]